MSDKNLIIIKRIIKRAKKKDFLIYFMILNLIITKFCIIIMINN